MGTTRWSPADWAAYVKTNKNKSRHEIFKKTMDKDLDPRHITFRESCDSDMNPNSTPVIVAVDQTGSMGFLAELLIRKGLGTLIEEIYAKKPVNDPHVMLMAVGDAWCDRAPLQVTQFETDIRLAGQLSKFFIEGGGGGNSYESYNLPWYFAATKTRCDAYLKRKKRGYLFTVGDEPPPPKLLKSHVQKFLGGGLETDLSSKELLKMASKQWDIYHIMIEEGSYFRSRPDKVLSGWQELLGQKALRLQNHKDLSELIVSTIAMAEGEDLERFTESYSSGTALTIRNALGPLAKLGGSKGLFNGLIRL